jgi:hypothetical protein
LGFEDGNASASAFNNDGDYNDYLFLFTSLTCNGGGNPCTVANQKGICAAGVNECNSAGTVTCKRINSPAATDGCDGLGPASLICHRRHCVAEVCATGISCPSDTVC